MPTETTETRTEYRVYVEQVGGPVGLRPEPLADAKARAKAIGTGDEVHSVRIQKRTVVVSPWEDVNEEATHAE